MRTDWQIDEYMSPFKLKWWTNMLLLLEYFPVRLTDILDPYKAFPHKKE
jgi:hypothetical protein